MERLFERVARDAPPAGPAGSRLSDEQRLYDGDRAHWEAQLMNQRAELETHWQVRARARVGAGCGRWRMHTDCRSRATCTCFHALQAPPFSTGTDQRAVCRWSVTE